MSSSLDQVLHDIEREEQSEPSTFGDPSLHTPVQSAGVGDLSPHLLNRSVSDTGFASPIAWADQGGGGSAAQMMLGQQTQVALSARQEKLPKLDLRLFGGVMAVFVMALGLSTATFLAGQSQDLRQQAYEGARQEQQRPVVPDQDQVQVSEYSGQSESELAESFDGQAQTAQDLPLAVSETSMTDPNASVSLWTPAFWGGVFFTFSLVMLGFLLLWIFQG